MRRAPGGCLKTPASTTTGRDRLSETVSQDRLLGGAVGLRQPVAGYRAAIDPVLLAAAVPARPGERVLDLGTGAGAAALSLLARVPGCRVVGLERDSQAAALAVENAALNGAADRFEVVVGDVGDLPGALEPGSFDQVMTNPPYLDPSTSNALPAHRAGATVEGEVALGAWLAAALAMAKRGGAVTVIHRADRLAEVLAGLTTDAGAVTVFPLWPKAGRAAKRVIVRARRGKRGPLALAPGLVLHRPDGGYTAEAEALLRTPAPLTF